MLNRNNMPYIFSVIFFFTTLFAAMWLGSELKSTIKGIPYEAILAFFGATATFLSSLVVSIRILKKTTEKQFGLSNLVVSSESQDPQFHSYLEKLLKEAERVVLIGTGLNVIQNDSIRGQLFRRAANEECNVEIYLADPESSLIENRLIEEELGEKKPPVAYGGLMSRLTSLLGDWKTLKRPDTIKLNLFRNYPTFALMIIDNNYFFYPYAFATLGNYSPVFRVQKNIKEHTCLVKFLEKNYELQKKHSVRLDTLDSYRSKTINNTRELFEFAIYFIPPEDNILYQVGSKILGYDIRTKQRSESTWPNEIGDAIHFGFHITISDALYFLNQSEIRYVTEEAKYILNKFSQFKLRSLDLRKSFPNKNSISLTVTDPSGNLEAMHHEMVQRIYKRAIGSRYSFGKSQLDRGANYERSKNMVARYNAPYILSEYTPHFTLLTKVPESKIDKRYDEVRSLLDTYHDEYIEVEKVAILRKEPKTDFWVIEEEVIL